MFRLLNVGYAPVCKLDLVTITGRRWEFVAGVTAFFLVLWSFVSLGVAAAARAHRYAEARDPGKEQINGLAAFVLSPIAILFIGFVGHTQAHFLPTAERVAWARENVWLLTIGTALVGGSALALDHKVRRYIICCSSASAGGNRVGHATTRSTPTGPAPPH